MRAANETLAYTPEVAAATAAIYERMKNVMPAVEWAAHAPLVKRINELKREKNAVILAHNYQTPEIFHGVADYVGDSLQLAREAAKTDATVIVQAGVASWPRPPRSFRPTKRF